MGDVKAPVSLGMGAAALVAVQVAHAAVPGPSEVTGSILGPIVGLGLLVASIAALVGAMRGRDWARSVLRTTGAIVAAGFLLYHAIPVKTPLNYPYWGKATANLWQWTPVLAAIAVGAWCTRLARPAPVLAVVGPEA
jgi:hypothetical protein